MARLASKGADIDNHGKKNRAYMTRQLVNAGLDAMEAKLSLPPLQAQTRASPWK